MGDDETGDGEVREGGVDRLLGLHVEVRGALVEDQDPGPAIERPREQHTLLLATGERRTHVPDQALVAHRHAFDVKALQQAVILGDEGDLASEALGVPAGQGLAVDVDRPGNRSQPDTGDATRKSRIPHQAAAPSVIGSPGRRASRRPGLSSMLYEARK